MAYWISATKMHKCRVLARLCYIWLFSFHFQVIARVFYCVNSSWTGRITIPELRNSTFLDVSTTQLICRLTWLARQVYMFNAFHRRVQSTRKTQSALDVNQNARLAWAMVLVPSPCTPHSPCASSHLWNAYILSVRDRPLHVNYNLFHFDDNG